MVSRPTAQNRPAPSAATDEATLTAMDGVVDGINGIAGMTAGGVAGLFAGGLVSGTILSAAGAASATASPAVFIATSGALLGCTVSGGWLGLKAGELASRWVGQAGSSAANVVGHSAPMGRTLAKSALAAAALGLGGGLGGSLVLRGAAVAAGMVLIGKGIKYGVERFRERPQVEASPVADVAVKPEGGLSSLSAPPGMTLQGPTDPAQQEPSAPDRSERADRLREQAKRHAWVGLALAGGLSIVGGANHFLIPPQPQASLIDTAGEYVDTVSNLSHLMLAGKLYGSGAREAEAMKAAHTPLSDVPNVAMARPLVIVPGWTTPPQKFDHLVARLTDGGRNGGQAYYIKEGRVFTDPDCTQQIDGVPEDARVFVTVFRDVLGNPDETAPQVGHSLELIRRGTGQEKVDALGYSLGGVATRVYLDQGGDLGKVILLGTPNRGTRFAQLATKLIERDIPWALEIADLNADHLPAMAWMSAGDSNPHMNDLNARWEDQVKHAEAVRIVGAEGMLTPSSGFWPMAGGDAMLETEGLVMEDADVHLLPGKGYKHHGNLPNDSDVYREMIDFYGWEAEPAP